jgi:hypothetical protein
MAAHAAARAAAMHHPSGQSRYALKKSGQTRPVDKEAQVISSSIEYISERSWPRRGLFDIMFPFPW